VVPFLSCAALSAEEAGTEKELHEISLPLRTALHHDPSLAAPLDRLVEMYRKVNRLDELITIYRSHLAQYPADSRALTVLIRVRLAIGDPEAKALAVTAVEQFPKNAYLHYLNYQALKANQEAGFLAALEKAVELEQSPSRKRSWVGTLLAEAEKQDKFGLIEKHLKTAAQEEGNGPEECLDIARKMIRYKFHEMALGVLTAAEKLSPSPQTMVDIQMACAAAETGSDRIEAAAARLDKLLSKVTADYWRRPEILRRRASLVKSDEERGRLLAAAREKVARSPNEEAAVLDLAQLLSQFDLRREAVTALLEGIRRIPASGRIDKELFSLYDRLHDEPGRETYLAERMKAVPDRKDIALRHVKSLFLLGRSKEATAELDGLLEGMNPAERVKQLLEMARFLRRSSLTSLALEMFTKVLEKNPARLDVRRELAESYLATGQVQKARDALKCEFPDDAPIENVLDLVQFMLEQRLLLEAREVITKRLKLGKSNFDLRLLLLTVEGRIGHFRAGRDLLLGTRELADTGARYRRWLESAIAFHDLFDTVEPFLDAEQERMEADAGDWSEKAMERRMAFIEVAASNGQEVEVATMLQDELEYDLKPEVRVKLRRKLVEILEQEKAQALVLEQHLRTLTQEDPGAADEYQARLALHHSRSNRHDLAMPLLQKLKPKNIQDPVLLSRLESVYRKQGLERQVVEILERLAALDPTNGGNWERWMTVLVARADEPRLRGTIRRLLAGVEKLTLSEETKSRLKSHLVDSYWRSAGQLLVKGDEGSLDEALILIDAVERIALTREQWLWVNWTRAHILGVLGRTKARDDAIGELERVIAQAPGQKKDQKPDEKAAEKRPVFEGLAFPDGLTVSLPYARKLLTQPPQPERRVQPADSQGPLSKMKVDWVFETAGPVTHILPIGRSRILISDGQGALSCVDVRTGKLLWESDSYPGFGMPYAQPGHYQIRRGFYSGPVPHHHYHPQGRGPNTQAPLEPITDREGRIFIPLRGGIECLSAEDGRLLWRATVSSSSVPGSGQAQAGSRVSVFLRKGKVLACDPATDAVAAFDRVTGKVVWEADNAPPAQRRAPNWTNSGAVLSGSRLMLYGQNTTVFNADTGEIEWKFEPGRVRKFPIRLEEAGDLAAASRPVSHPPRSYAYQGGRYAQRASYHPSGRYYAPPSRAPKVQHVIYNMPSLMGWSLLSSQRSGYSTAFASAGATWASGRYAYQPRRGAIFDDRLLLFGQHGLLVLRLDLPLGATHVATSGVFIGMSGRIACLLQHGTVVFINVVTGQSKSFSLSEIATGNDHAEVQAAIDGSLVHLTGPQGILCVNAHSASKVLKTPWPEAVAKLPRTPGSSSVNYQWHGRYYHLNNVHYPAPIVARVTKGGLLTTLGLNRVVALSEPGDNGE